MKSPKEKSKWAIKLKAKENLKLKLKDQRLETVTYLPSFPRPLLLLLLPPLRPSELRAHYYGVVLTTINRD